MNESLLVTQHPFTLEIGLTLAVIGFTFYLFISDKFSTDISAILILVVIGAVSQIPQVDTLLPPSVLFSGFSSNAVIALIALMIMAGGIERSGAMDRVAQGIVNLSRGRQFRVIALVCGSAGLMSGVIQNIGVVALFVPVASYLSVHTQVPINRILMPMSFSVILGGNLTIMGNSSLIVLNDIIRTNSAPEINTHAFPIFAVFPYGCALLCAGVILFCTAANRLFPEAASTKNRERSETVETSSLQEPSLQRQTETADSVTQAPSATVAITCFGGSLILALLSDFPIGWSLWSGVLAMFLLKVINPESAYRAVSWNTVVMLAGLIPLGIAVDYTGTASWISTGLVRALPPEPFLIPYPVLIQITLALLTASLTLVMSNVGATVLLVPLAIQLGQSTGQDPIALALLVGLCASNSFLLPTHQANALVLATGHYRVAEFTRVGLIVTSIYLGIVLVMINTLT
ncbi:MAG: hypothetical protein MI864_16975 [Pseudomonadales bacterium]|nr:hypothetical protein [Pseudomonadales bacterium]